MIPRGMLVTPETWRVVREGDSFAFVSQLSGRRLADESELRQVEVMHGMAAWALLLNQL